jgi:predicted HAD superfamily Cof-like phosphohydrolase
VTWGILTLKGTVMRNKTNLDKVREFHQAMGLDLDVDITKGDNGDLIRLRGKLIEEEYEELFDATSTENLLKELADLVYVCYGFAATFGWDLDVAFNRVHQSNMSKLGDDGKPIYREDGKVLKSKNYVAPDLSDLV